VSRKVKVYGSLTELWDDLSNDLAVSSGQASWTSKVYVLTLAGCQHLLARLEL
jgi:hypothetical protein